ncbi:MAG: hypothetical protein NC483_02640 [Ruminococcus sp.]|nr:hypothetical protein [Ruminococcus sp.]
MDIRRGKIYALIFVLFIIFLALGGFFLTNYLTKSSKDKDSNIEEKVPEEKSLKILDNEEYIYFEDEEIKSESLDISFKKIKININSKEAGGIETKLNDEMDTLEENLKKISDMEIEDGEQEEIVYKEDDIYSAEYINYTRYFYKDYASILIDKYSFDCFSGSKYLTSSSYTFDTSTGKIITNDEILDIYSTNMTKIKMEVQEKLAKKEDEEIDIANTLNNLDNSDNYAIYINKSGYLTLSYLVKSTKNDYNDVIIFN